MDGLPELIAALNGSAAAAPQALDTQRHHAAENSGRSATAWTTYDSAGTGTFSPPDAFQFDVAFVDKPAFFYGVECTGDLPEGADAPLSSGYVSGWVTDPDGNFTGAYLTANVSEAPLTVMLTHHFTFSGVATKTLATAANLPGAVTPTTDATQLPTNPIVDASNNPQAPSKGQLHATLVQAQATLAQAQADIDAKISYGAAAPTDATPGTPGNVFYVQAGDPLEVTEQYICTAGTGAATGNTWEQQQLNAAQLVVPGTVEAVHLAVTQDVTGKTFTGGMFLGQTFIGAEFKSDTAGRRLEIGHNQSGGTDPSNIGFFNGFAGEVPGLVGPYGGEDASHASALAIISPTTTTWNQSAQADVVSGKAATTFKKANGVAAWQNEPQLAAWGNLQVHGDIWTGGRLRQGGDTAGMVALTMSSLFGGYGAPYGWASATRTGDNVTLSGLVKSTQSVALDPGYWLVSNLPAPADGCQQLFPTYIAGVFGGVYLALVSGSWCITNATTIPAGGYVSLNGITYTCAP